MQNQKRVQNTSLIPVLKKNIIINKQTERQNFKKASSIRKYHIMSHPAVKKGTPASAY